MTSQLSLTKPNTLKTLRRIRLSLIVVLLVGSAVGGYSLLCVRKAVNAENERMASLRKQCTEMRDVLNSKRKDALRADKLQTQSPNAAGSAFFIQEVNHLAEQMHLSHFTIRMMESAPTAQKAPPANGGNANNGNANAAAPANGGASEGPLANWEKSGFEAEVAGEFRDLSDFLKRLSAIPYVVDVVSVDVHPLGKGIKEKSGKLLMHMSGALYGLPQNTEQPHETQTAK